MLTTLKNSLLLITFVLLNFSYAASQAIPFDPCSSKIEEFKSQTLADHSLPSARDKDGKWLNSTRGIEAACGSAPKTQIGQTMAVSIRLFCGATQKIYQKVIIPNARLQSIDHETFATVGLDISKADYDWLVQNGYYDPNERLARATFYADCER